MIQNALSLITAQGNQGSPLYADDVFSTYLYTGNESDQFIENNIGLASTIAFNVSSYVPDTWSTGGQEYFEEVDTSDNSVFYITGLRVYDQSAGNARSGVEIIKKNQSGTQLYRKLIWPYLGNSSAQVYSVAITTSYVVISFLAGLIKINKSTGDFISFKSISAGSNSFSYQKIISHPGSDDIYFAGNHVSGTDPYSSIGKYNCSTDTTYWYKYTNIGSTAASFYDIKYTNSELFISTTGDYVFSYNPSTGAFNNVISCVPGGNGWTGIDKIIDADQTYVWFLSKSYNPGYSTNHASIVRVNRSTGATLANVLQTFGQATYTWQVYINGSDILLSLGGNDNGGSGTSSYTKALVFRVDKTTLNVTSTITEFRVVDNANSYFRPRITPNGRILYGFVGSPYTLVKIDISQAFNISGRKNTLFHVFTKAVTPNTASSSLTLSISTSNPAVISSGTTLSGTDIGTTNTTFSNNLGTYSSYSFNKVENGGGMVWLKGRSVGSDYSYGDHEIFDTVTEGGLRKFLKPNKTDALGTNGSLQANGFTSTGFVLNTGTQLNNRLSDSIVSWTFRKAPKFFDCGTYTGNGTAGRQIPHSLGVAPGMVIVKCTSNPHNWAVWHRSLSADYNLLLNGTQAQLPGSSWADAIIPIASANTTSFTLGSGSGARESNQSGLTYVWYAFAHDTSADGIIQCGSYTGNGGATNTINLGCEVQFALIKKSSAAGGWVMLDTPRGMSPPSAYCQFLEANTSSAEGNTNAPYPVAVGFEAGGTNYNDSGATYIYLAIRRPNKPPTSGTQVYNAIARTGTGAAATVTGVGFAPDLMILADRQTAGAKNIFYDRLRGKNSSLASYTTTTETGLFGGSDNVSLIQNGADINNVATALNGSVQFIHHFFRRAPGVFDVVCYTGTGSATTVAHNLGVAPELMIVKARDNTTSWPVYASGIGNSNALYVNLTDQSSTSSVWNNTTPTASVFSLGTSTAVNGSGFKFIAYLFATKAGISKVGAFTKSDDNFQTIDCGFTTGARFVMIKRTSATGGWYVWDSVRGIVAANDPFLYLNSTASEDSSYDFIDPHSSGFQIGGILGNGDYIYLAFA